MLNAFLSAEKSSLVKLIWKENGSPLVLASPTPQSEAFSLSSPTLVHQSSDSSFTASCKWFQGRICISLPLMNFSSNAHLAFILISDPPKYSLRTTTTTMCWVIPTLGVKLWHLMFNKADSLTVSSRPWGALTALLYFLVRKEETELMQPSTGRCRAWTHTFPSSVSWQLPSG